MASRIIRVKETRRCSHRTHNAHSLSGLLDESRSQAHAIMARTKKRIFSHVHKHWLNQAAEVFLQGCYATRTPARVADLAAALERNPEYLTRTSASISGSTLLKLLRRQQLEEAERLLVTTPVSIADIALSATFGDQSTLYRCFMQHHGLSPSQFRKVRKHEGLIRRSKNRATVASRARHR